MAFYIGSVSESNKVMDDAGLAIENLTPERGPGKLNGVPYFSSPQVSIIIPEVRAGFDLYSSGTLTSSANNAVFEISMPDINVRVWKLEVLDMRINNTKLDSLNKPCFQVRKTTGNAYLTTDDYKNLTIKADTTSTYETNSPTTHDSKMSYGIHQLNQSYYWDTSPTTWSYSFTMIFFNFDQIGDRGILTRGGVMRENTSGQYYSSYADTMTYVDYSSTLNGIRIFESAPDMTGPTSGSGPQLEYRLYAGQYKV